METEALKLIGFTGVGFIFLILVALIFYVWKSVLEARNLVLQNKLMKKELEAGS